MSSLGVQVQGVCRLFMLESKLLKPERKFFRSWISLRSYPMEGYLYPPQVSPRNPWYRPNYPSIRYLPNTVVTTPTYPCCCYFGPWLLLLWTLVVATLDPCCCYFGPWLLLLWTLVVATLDPCCCYFGPLVATLDPCCCYFGPLGLDITLDPLGPRSNTTASCFMGL